MAILACLDVLGVRDELRASDFLHRTGPRSCGPVPLSPTPDRFGSELRAGAPLPGPATLTLRDPRPFGSTKPHLTCSSPRGDPGCVEFRFSYFERARVV